MSLWIRIDANIGDNPNVWKLAELRGVSAEACVGLLVILFGRVAENRPSGDVSDVPDALLERWAGWTGEPGAFARDFRTLFVSDGVIDGWHKRQGKLLERAEKERERWHRRNSTESDAKLRGGSAEESAVRDETLRNKKNKQKKPSATDLPTFPPEFEAFWQGYPSEYRGSKRPALKQWDARLDEGHTPAVIQAGAERYIAYCHAMGRHLKNASTFIGPDMHFLEPWTLPQHARREPGADGPRVLRATEQVIA